MAKRLSFPFRVSPLGGLATLSVDSDAEIAQSIALLLATTPGERRSVPGYGLGDMLLGGQFDVEEISDAISDWEDRADPTRIEVVTDSLAQPYVTVYPAAPATDEGEE